MRADAPCLSWKSFTTFALSTCSLETLFVSSKKSFTIFSPRGTIHNGATAVVPLPLFEFLISFSSGRFTSTHEYGSLSSAFSPPPPKMSKNTVKYVFGGNPSTRASRSSRRLILCVASPGVSEAHSAVFSEPLKVLSLSSPTTSCRPEK